MITVKCEVSSSLANFFSGLIVGMFVFRSKKVQLKQRNVGIC